MSTRHERERLKAAALAAIASQCAVCHQAIIGLPFGSLEMGMSGNWNQLHPTSQNAPDIVETLDVCSLKCAVSLSVRIHMHFVDAWDLDDHIMAEVPGATHDMILQSLLDLVRQEKATHSTDDRPPPFVPDAVLIAEAEEAWKRSHEHRQS
jgi:hypothetical protein